MTREEAIKVCTKEKECIRQALGECAEGDKYVSPDGIITAIDYVEAMTMAISALREQPRWISVEERLPERGVKVLCHMNFLKSEETKSWGTNIAENTYQGVLVGSNPRKHVWEWQGDFVTHWMPLPEPPEVEV